MNKEVLIKAGKTFWQTALGALVLPTAGVYNLKTWIGVIVVAIATGASAAYNGVIAPWLAKK